jgi:hypothetical protein
VVALKTIAQAPYGPPLLIPLIYIYIYIMGLVGLHTYYVFAHFLGGAGWLEYFTLLYSTLLLA